MGFPSSLGTEELVPPFASMILDTLPDMVIVLDLQGRVFHANHPTLEQLGFTIEELVAGGLELVLVPADATKVRRLVQEVTEGKGARLLSLNSTTKAGKKLTLEAVIGTLVIGERPVGVWFRARDVTARKNVEAELEDVKNYVESVSTSLEEGIVTIDRNGTVLRWSPAMERMLLLAPKEMMGRPVYTIVKDDDQRRRFINRLKEVAGGRPLSDMEYSHVDKNDREVTISITSAPLFDRLGKVKEIVLVVKDLTEKKHLEERLKESEKRLATEVIKKIEDLKYIEQLNRIVVEYMEEGAILLDASLDIGFINPKLAKLLGYRTEELVGRSLQGLVPEDLLWAWNEIADRSKRTSYKFESSMVRKDGEEFPVMVTASSIKVETRKAEFLCTILDLTEQKAKEEATKEEMMEFKLKPGRVYLLLERGYGKALDVLMTLRRFGHRAIVVSRRGNRDDIKDLIKDSEADAYWLEEKGRGIWSLLTSRQSLYDFMDRTVDRTKAVLLDRIDYLVTKLGFGEVLSLVHDLSDLMQLRKAVLILLVDPSNLAQDQIEKISKDASIVEAKRALILPGDLQDLLVYIYQQNRLGIEPSYKDIGKRFNITKTTTRKRVQQLQILDLIVETKHGRTKVIRLADRGLRFIPSKK